jgi:putative transposase
MKDAEEYKEHVRRRSIRLREFDYKGEYNYFVTCVCKDHRRTFYPGPLANDIIGALLNTADDKGFSVICYCLMPDHIHFVLHGNSDKADLVKFMQLFKQRSEYIGKRSGIEKIWRRSYYDHVIRKYESLAKIVKYVLDNPFRAGLVEEGEEYPLACLLTEDL